MPAQYIPTHYMVRVGVSGVMRSIYTYSCAVHMLRHTQPQDAALRGRYPAQRGISPARHISTQSPTRVPLGYCAGPRAGNMLRPALEVAIKTSQYFEGYGRMADYKTLAIKLCGSQSIMLPSRRFYGSVRAQTTRPQHIYEPLKYKHLSTFINTQRDIPRGLYRHIKTL